MDGVGDGEWERGGEGTDMGADLVVKNPNIALDEVKKGDRGEASIPQKDPDDLGLDTDMGVGDPQMDLHLDDNVPYWYGSR